MRKYLVLLSVLFLVVSCTSSYKTRQLEAEDVTKTLDDLDRSNCKNVLSYAPDSSTWEILPDRTLYLNFHIMRKSDGTGCFQEQEGIKYCESLVKSGNYWLERNTQMFLPIGNETAVLPTQIKYEIYKDPLDPTDSGVYFHNDDEHYYFVKNGKHRNNYDNTAFQKYGKFKGDVLNVFILPHHPDSVASKTYNPSITGIAFRSNIKVAGFYESAIDTQMVNGKPFVKGAWFCQSLMNHEIGHVLGLSHTWRGNDGCDDTPNHPNCWSRSDKPPCDTEVSNNVMDYNTHQTAWTPCQLGKVHYNFSTKGSSFRKMLKPTWCERDPEKDIRIKKNTIWDTAKDLSGNVIVETGKSLEIGCRISFPRDAYIEVAPGASLILNGCTLESDCGGSWKGIIIGTNRKEKGQVIIKKKPELTHTETNLDFI